MKFPFFASFIVFCIWLTYEIKKHNKQQSKSLDSFWEREAQANKTRKKPLTNLPLITIPFESLPMDILTDEPLIKEYHETLYSMKEEPIANLTGITNTELKLQYGAPNLNILSLYDQRYTILARTLQSWADLLYEKGYPAQACTVLEFAVSTGTDISATYKLLASIYDEKGQREKIADLIPVAENLNSAMKGSILRTLKSYN